MVAFSDSTIYDRIAVDSTLYDRFDVSHACIQVSNFMPEQLTALLATAKIKPCAITVLYLRQFLRRFCVIFGSCCVIFLHLREVFQWNNADFAPDFCCKTPKIPCNQLPGRSVNQISLSVGKVDTVTVAFCKSKGSHSGARGLSSKSCNLPLFCWVHL